ncbi:MAG: amidohydrolase family protein [Phaeodactylibacter sp.]|nr:amidohydrolase family protein [Phaeodactylibacter sp.]
MIIDAHHHLWKYQPEEYPWISEALNPLMKDFLPEALEKVLQKNSIRYCVAVEARATEKENEFLIALARKHAFIKGVVGWLDLRAEGLEEKLEHYAQFPVLKGFRYNVQEETDNNFLLRPGWLKGMEAFGKYHFTFDLLVYPHQLGAALELARRFPGQKFVIDHLAKPYVKDGYFDGWAILMKALSELPNVWCKVSGMVTEADWKNWKYEDFLPYLSHVFECFGAKRLMFGSDWPVCLLAASYRQVKDIVENFLAPLSAEDKQSIWADTAIDFYQLKI